MRARSDPSTVLATNVGDRQVVGDAEVVGRVGQIGVYKSAVEASERRHGLFDPL
jgi:hypothetical protein